jgi:hypothetical protein
MPASDLATREGKGVVTSIAEENLATAAAPLAAIYLLKPVPAERAGQELAHTLERIRVPTVRATVALVANFKLARMTGSQAMPEVLQRASVIASSVPVYCLSVPRSLDMLESVSDLIREWHTLAHARSTAR